MSDADFQHIPSRKKHNAAVLGADSRTGFHLVKDDSARKNEVGATLRQLTTTADHFFNRFYFGDTLTSVQFSKERRKTQKLRDPLAWLS